MWHGCRFSVHGIAHGGIMAVRFRVRPSVADPDDDLVLEAAIATASQWIVTHNIRDMVAGAARYGIEVITPGEALRRLEVAQ